MWVHLLAQSVPTSLPTADISIPWPLVLGPYGLLVYLVIENIWLRRENREMRKSSDDLSKTAFEFILKHRDRRS